MSDSVEQNKTEISKKIIQCLNEESLKFDEGTDPYFSFKVTFYPMQNMPLQVLIEKQKIDSIKLVSRSGFTEQDKKTLAAFKEKRVDFVRRLREAFFHSCVVANFYPDYNNIQFIEIQKTIYFDCLSKHLFFEYVDDIIRALSWLVLEYERLNGSHNNSFLAGFVI